jgi:hypothetical protein
MSDQRAAERGQVSRSEKLPPRHQTFKESLVQHVFSGEISGCIFNIWGRLDNRFVNRLPPPKAQLAETST